MNGNAASFGVPAPSPNVVAQQASASAIGQRCSRSRDRPSLQANIAKCSPSHVGHICSESVTLHTARQVCAPIEEYVCDFSADASEYVLF
jgi:hypothetical protein